MKQVKGFLFDLDGVITDTAHFHYLAWKKLAEKLDINFTEEDNEQLKGISRMESLEILLRLGKKENDFTESQKMELAKEKNDYYVSLIETITPKDILPNIKELLISAKNNDIKIGLTSASKNGPFVLKKLEIEGFFDTIVDPNELKNGKPDPEIFIKGSEQLELETTECIGFEDAEAGIKSINCAGMYSVGVGDAETLSESDYLVASTQDLYFDSLMKVYYQNKSTP